MIGGVALAAVTIGRNQIIEASAYGALFELLHRLENWAAAR
ncbi:hypothetical protein SAMN05892877_10493 [Rhizobium subbaraonis]|uniref:Uncharacterized protein n=1 Tax=Rhizobium subbaraonis TaxID=908946 RepID=A0A285U5T1_9HYPH|nr:hypothetical protein SAMN05892877_10493 [Rhizobium subbaraonis]